MGRDGPPLSVAGSRGPGEKLVFGRVVDQAELQLAVEKEGDRDAPARHAAEKGLGAVDRIDDPDAAAAGDVVGAGLLAEEGVVREGLGDALLIISSTSSRLR